MLQFFSFLICLLIATGIYHRHNRKRHVPLMLTAFGLDMLMVLYIELTRDAINEAIHPPHPFVTFHVVISVLVVVLYLTQLFSGLKLLKFGTHRRFHKISAAAFIVMRLANLITSLFVEQFAR